MLVLVFWKFWTFVYTQAHTQTLANFIIRWQNLFPSAYVSLPRLHTTCNHQLDDMDTGVRARAWELSPDLCHPGHGKSHLLLHPAEWFHCLFLLQVQSHNCYWEPWFTKNWEKKKTRLILMVSKLSWVGRKKVSQKKFEKYFGKKNLGSKWIVGPKRF